MGSSGGLCKCYGVIISQSLIPQMLSQLLKLPTHILEKRVIRIQLQASMETSSSQSSEDPNRPRPGKEKADSLPRAGSWPHTDSRNNWGLFPQLAQSFRLIFNSVSSPWRLFMGCFSMSLTGEATADLWRLHNICLKFSWWCFLSWFIALHSSQFSSAHQKITGTDSWKCRFLFLFQF